MRPHAAPRDGAALGVVRSKTAHFRAGMHRGVLRDAAGKMINATCCGIAWGMILIECVGPTRHEPAPSGVNSVRRAPRQHLTASAAPFYFLFSPPAQPH